MHEEPTPDTQNASDESQEDTEKLIGEINNLIARIKRLRACIALYLVSNDLNDRKFP